MSHYTEADVQAAFSLLVAAPLENSEEQDVRLILDAVAPAITARAKAEALRELAEEMDGGSIDWDDLRYKTTDAPKGWVESFVEQVWESQLLWAPYLRHRADQIEQGQP